MSVHGDVLLAVVLKAECRLEPHRLKRPRARRGRVIRAHIGGPRRLDIAAAAREETPHGRNLLPEIGELLIGEVAADREPVREPAHRLVAQRGREGGAVEVLVPLDIVLVDLGHVQQVATVRAVQPVGEVAPRLAPGRRARPDDPRRDGLLGAGRPQLAPPVPQPEVHRDLRARCVGDVGAAIQPVPPVVIHRAFVAVPPTKEVIAQRLVPARNRRFVRPGIADGERRALAHVSRLLVRLRTRSVVAHREADVPVVPQHVGVHDVARGALVIRVLEEVGRIGKPVGALLDLERDPGAAAGPALRDDVDHAVRGLRAVQRRRRGALDHLDARDLVGIDVVDPGGRIASVHAHAADAGDAPRVGRRVVDAHAVDVDERLGRERHAARPAHARVPTRADIPTGRLHPHAGDHVQQLLHIGGRRHLQDVGYSDLAEGVAERPPRLLLRSSRDDDLVERGCGLLQGEIDRHRAGVGHGHLLRRLHIAEPPRAQGVRPGRHGSDAIPPIDAAQCSELRTLELYPHVGERLVGRGIADGSSDGGELERRRLALPVPRCGGAGDCQDQQDQEEARTHERCETGTSHRTSAARNDSMHICTHPRGLSISLALGSANTRRGVGPHPLSPSPFGRGGTMHELSRAMTLPARTG